MSVTYCHECGFQNPESAKYCSRCGALLSRAEPAAETTELRLLLGVRDRVHLAEVMRTLRRSPAVLRVGRVKP